MKDPPPFLSAPLSASLFFTLFTNSDLLRVYLFPCELPVWLACTLREQGCCFAHRCVSPAPRTECSSYWELCVLLEIMNLKPDYSHHRYSQCSSPNISSYPGL